MPPKPRGSARGGARGRGSGRGGASSGTARAAPAAAPPEQSETATATEATNTIVPKAEEDSGTALEGLSLSTAVESQLAPLAPASSISSPQTVADSPARPPVQRLDSLKIPAPSSRSASPAARRGTTTRGARSAAVKPTFTGRRSKEERDARDKKDRDRQKERDREAEAKLKQKERERKRSERGGANKRGGYTGPVTGPFSLGSSTQDRKTGNRSNQYSASGSGSGSRAVHIKHEYNGAEGGGSYRSSGTSGIKRENGGYVSSDDDDDNAEFPRKDIDLIEISSDEETAGSSHHKERTNLPVRISRKEHHDRVVGINTEASAETPAKSLQPANAIGTSPTVEVVEGTSRKEKGKVKDLEITGVRKPYKGMWQDADEPQVQVKAEPASDDEDQGLAEEVGIYEASNKAAGDSQPLSPESEKKAKARMKVGPEPVMQTDEDRQEWARFQSSLRHIRAELGPGAEDDDAAGDILMSDAGETAGKAKLSVRDNNVYLFQIPPVMPDLFPPTVKNESSDEPPNPPPTTQLTPIKTEEGVAGAASKATIASGFVGKLRVHQSGRTTLDWGGTSYELNPGHKASYLQEVVSLNVVPEKERLMEEDGGEAISYGRVKGKFVVVPAWEQMLG